MDPSAAPSCDDKLLFSALFGPYVRGPAVLVNPDTGAPTEGDRTPEWDIVVAQGKSWFLEADHNPELAVQLFCFYLKDPRTRWFFEHHGVIQGRGLRCRRLMRLTKMHL